MTKNTSKMSEYKKKIDPFLLDGSTQMISTTLAVLNVRKQHMSNFLNLENSSDGFDSNDKHDDLEITFENPEDNNNESLIPTKIFGSEELKKKIILLCNQYKDIFSTKLKKDPADLPAMEIKVNSEKWNTAKHRGPPRVQSNAKQNETLRQVNEMLNSKIVQPSQASEYSHPLLTPKPDGSWRFCLDYRFLNECSECTGWPIPNIQLMLHRIGEHKSKIFGIMDLTKGYYQAPLSAASRIHTAFMTFMGIFEWLRVPMGIKGAPAYFQRVLSTVVLVGLLYVSCELYIDDIIVHAQTEDDFIERLKSIFSRFRKHKMTVNPIKCSFGMPEVQFVGHIVNDKGLTFSKDKIDTVLNIPRPINQKGIRKFIGVVNYFRNHIRSQSTIIKPLYDMIHNYQPQKKVMWNDKAIIEAFNNIKNAINNLPTLYFLDNNAPVFLHTDASDYGIGGYLFQLVDGKEQPTSFMSKALTKEECRWSTPEKEAYAIYYSFLKFEHLIRDIKFTVRTDHKNLTYLNNENNPKVKRWKIAIQEYDFDIEYIPGEKNIVADGFSRLLPIVDEEILCLLNEFTLDKPSYKKISKVHNSIAGHHGVERTLKKLNEQNETWEYMREHVKRFIKQCPCCQKMSHIKIQIHTHPFTTATYEPMMRLNIDTINGLPPDEFGNRSLIVIKDCFSRWIEIFPTSNETASVAASALLQHVGRYGCPSQILSDNGPQYVNELIKEFTKLIGTEYITTLAYSKEENAIVERANKETLRHLKAIIFDKNVIEKWSKDTIPFVQRIINASIDKSIGVAPAQILYGNSINLDHGIFLPLHQISDNDTHNNNINNTKLSKWTDKMLQTQQAIIKAAQITQHAKDDKHIANANAKRTEFIPESYVLIEYPSSNMKPGPPNKMMANLKGPMQVINNEGNTYTVKNLLTGKHEKYHVKQLRQFNYEPQHTDPFNIAIKDQQEHVIEAILNHSGDKQNKTEMEFLVRWKGESDENNLWMPWKEVRRNPILHKYLQDNKMKSIIPIEFRE